MGGDRGRVARLVERIGSIGALPGDGPEEALRKRLLVLGTVLTTTLSFVWVGTYWALDLRLPAAIPFAYQLASVANLALFARTRRATFFLRCDLALSLLLPFVLQLSLGGFLPSSGVVLWSFSAPLGALLFTGARGALPWFGGFLGIIAASAGLDPVLTNQPDIPRALVIAFFAMNILGPCGWAYALLHHFVNERERYATALAAERERSEALLLNILPEPIAERLKDGETLIADARGDVGVLFADIVGFTPMAECMEPDEVVRLLDDIFRSFDRLAATLGLEKIKTIGDAYMVASGLLDDDPRHAERLAEMALAMRDEIARRGILDLRIGIDVGPVVAGVIGQSRSAYDLWGDTVNTASRMESHGLPGKIQATERARVRLEATYRFEPRGEIEVKGKGRMATWLLVGPVENVLSAAVPLQAV